MILLSLFNFGDSYYSDSGNSICRDLAIQVVATGLAFLGTYFIFRQQIHHERDRETAKETANEISLLKYVQFNLEKTINGIELQKSYLRDFIDSSNINSFKLSLKISASVNLDWIKEVDMVSFREIFFKYYGQDDEGSSYYLFEMINRTNIVRVIQSKLTEYHDEIRKDVDKHSDSLNKTYIIFQREVVKLLNSPYTNDEDKKFKSELDKLTIDFARQNQEKRELPTFKYYFLMVPIRELCKEYQRSELQESYLPLLYAYKYLNSVFAQKDDSFEKIYETYKTVGSRLSVINRQLKKVIKDLPNKMPENK